MAYPVCYTARNPARTSADIEIHSSFAACLYCRPVRPNEPKTSTLLPAHITFLFVTLVPALIGAICNGTDPEDRESAQWFSAIFGGIHPVFVNPVVTALGISAVFLQARKICSQPSLGALSAVGLATQAVAFAVVAISWMVRVNFPYELIDRVVFGDLVSWYQLVGWAAVNNAVFAIGQAVLLSIVIRRGLWASEMASTGAGETESLLHDSSANNDAHME